MCNILASLVLGILAIAVEFGAGEGTGSILAAVPAAGLFVFLVQLRLARRSTAPLSRSWPCAVATTAPTATLTGLAWRAHEPAIQVVGGLAATVLIFLATLAALGLAARRARRPPA